MMLVMLRVIGRMLIHPQLAEFPIHPQLAEFLTPKRRLFS